MFKSIVTHRGLAHPDDFLSCCILLTKFPEIETIRRETNLDFLNEDGVNEKDYIFVDIGQDYDGKRYFDHHHDTYLYCSLVLILKDIFNYDIDFLMKIPEIKFIDLKDRYGLKEAEKNFNITNPIINLVEYSMLRWFSKQIVISDTTLDFLKEIGREFLNYINDFKREEEKILKSKIYQNPNGIILYNPNITLNLTIITKLIPNLIGVIHQSDRDPSLINIIQINNNPYFMPTKIITSEINPVFVHKTGFLITVKKEDLNKINLFNFIGGGE
jgi:hypothetical protein